MKYIYYITVVSVIRDEPEFHGKEVVLDLPITTTGQIKELEKSIQERDIFGKSSVIGLVLLRTEP